jgi:hypothetical protein
MSNHILSAVGTRGVTRISVDQNGLGSMVTQLTFVYQSVATLVYSIEIIAKLTFFLVSGSILIKVF